MLQNRQDTDRQVKSQQFEKIEYGLRHNWQPGCGLCHERNQCVHLMMQFQVVHKLVTNAGAAFDAVQYGKPVLRKGIDQPAFRIVASRSRLSFLHVHRREVKGYRRCVISETFEIGHQMPGIDNLCLI